MFENGNLKDVDCKSRQCFDQFCFHHNLFCLSKEINEWWKDKRVESTLDHSQFVLILFYLSLLMFSRSDKQPFLVPRGPTQEAAVAPMAAVLHQHNWEKR